MTGNIIHNELWMHDLLRDMGRDIVRQESCGELGKLSRLWLYKDINLVLKNNTGTKKVQAMDIRLAEPNELVQLHLQHSKIEFLWEGMKNFDKLKSLNMAGSSNLIKVPNFNGVPKLEELVLEGCSKLRTLDPSIGKLKNLKLLNLKKCQELTSLPNKVEWESLVTLNLTGCSKVKKIPEYVGNMKHLQEFLLEGIAIIELPSSIECLTGLNTLILKNCKNLVCLPNIICSLTSLNNLNFFGCSKFDKLPKDLGDIISIKNLDLSGTAIKELPSSIEFLTGLGALALEDCKKFVLLPSIVCSLKSLETMYLFRCPKFVNLPDNLGNLIHLSNLCFEGTAIEVLPSSVTLAVACFLLSLSSVSTASNWLKILKTSVTCFRDKVVKNLRYVVLFLEGKFRNGLKK